MHVEAQARGLVNAGLEHREREGRPARGDARVEGAVAWDSANVAGLGPAVIALPRAVTLLAEG